MPTPEQLSEHLSTLIRTQSEFKRIQSENLLLRQQLQDAQAREQQRIAAHEEQLHRIALGAIIPQQIAEQEIKRIINTLTDWSEKLFNAHDSEIDRSSCCDESYYTRERDIQARESRERYELIEQLDDLLRKAIGATN